MKTENERIIDVCEDPVDDSRPTEIPEISIERYAEHHSEEVAAGARRGGKVIGIRFWIGVAAVVAVLAVAGIFFFSDRWHVVGGDAGRKRMLDNIAVLSGEYTPSSEGVSPMTDSILDVTMDIYPLAGLKASLEWEFPDTADRSLVMFMRSVDYLPDGRALGSIVVDGIGSDSKSARCRDGYVALSSQGRTVIGISSEDDIEEWTRKNKGSFFRQMVLLDDGELPRDFVLKGKVERGAIASAVDGTLYYIVTRERESMYDFADALREYGFVDAVYMTGGNTYSFHRDSTGNFHVNTATLEKIRKYDTIPLNQPLLVFRSSHP